MEMVSGMSNSRDDKRPKESVMKLQNTRNKEDPRSKKYLKRKETDGIKD